MAKKTQIVKELKRPDQFVDFWTHAWNRIAAVLGPRRRPLLAVVTAAVVAAAGVAIFDQLDEGHRVTASEALDRITRIANADLTPATADAPEAAAAKDDVPHFKTDAERQTAVLKELDGFLGGAGGKTDLRDEALVMKGAALLQAGRFDDAAAAYQAALASKLSGRLKFLAHEGLGYAAEGKGDLDKALAAFALLTDDAKDFEGFYRDRAVYHKARLTERKGDRPGAVKLYKEVLEKNPDTALHDEISDRLALLEAK